MNKVSRGLFGLVTVSAVFALAASVSVDTACLGEHEDDFLSEPVSEEAKTQLDDGERDFGLALIKHAFYSKNQTGVHKNIFMSPASVYQTLVLAYFGAKDQTEKALSKTLGFGDLERSDVVKNYLFERAFQAIRDQDPNLGYELTHANKFFFDNSLPLSQCLQLVLQDELEAVDFAGNSGKALKQINQWVEDKTRSKIVDFLPPGAIDGSTKVALANAAYFKGNWKSKFNASETKSNNFYVRRDKISMTDFMEQKGKFNYYTSEELRAHVLELPYVGDEVSMVIVLPPFEEDSLFETVSRLTPKTLKGVMAEVKSGFYEVDDLTVRIPKFRIEQTFELTDALADLGLKALFDPTKADLSRFLAEGANEHVALQSAIHKSFIEVNEEGSEAAAASALFGFRSARPLFHTEFVADHPFVFLIYDKPSDTILFFGMYQDPKN